VTRATKTANRRKGWRARTPVVVGGLDLGVPADRHGVIGVPRALAQ
jgi:hypothetical protein